MIDTLSARVISALAAVLTAALAFAVLVIVRDAYAPSASTPITTGSIGADATGSARRGSPLEGIAYVVDGDTITLGTERLRLEGIDAPEQAQTCATAYGAQWAAGRMATRQLAQAIEGKRVSCRAESRDDYGRLIATCFVDGQNVNAMMVATGYAWAFVKYSDAYVAEERLARKAGLGIWRATCEPAWAYRKQRWSTETASAPGKCPIKGNISGAGRIYHTPWSPWYGKTSIDERRGERWFCSESEAIAAGWRPAQPS